MSYYSTKVVVKLYIVAVAVETKATRLQFSNIHCYSVNSRWHHIWSRIQQHPHVHSVLPRTMESIPVLFQFIPKPSINSSIGFSSLTFHFQQKQQQQLMTYDETSLLYDVRCLLVHICTLTDQFLYLFQITIKGCLAKRWFIKFDGFEEKLSKQHGLCSRFCFCFCFCGEFMEAAK